MQINKLLNTTFSRHIFNRHRQGRRYKEVAATLHCEQKTKLYSLTTCFKLDIIVFTAITELPDMNEYFDFHGATHTYRQFLAKAFYN